MAGRQHSFAQGYDPTVVDRFGVWLSSVQIRKHVPSLAGKAVSDLGCGYQASFARSILDVVRSVLLVDVAIAPDLKEHPKVKVVEGYIPGVLAEIEEGTIDVAMAISVLEHVEEPLSLLREMRRITAPGGKCLINVPSWRGKVFLEYSAFHLHLSPASEMDDHKMYYAPKDLWPLLVQAGFVPSDIKCFAHKFGLNTFAACTKR